MEGDEDEEEGEELDDDAEYDEEDEEEEEANHDSQQVAVGPVSRTMTRDLGRGNTFSAANRNNPDL